MIRIFIYNLDSGLFVCDDTGQPNEVIHDIKTNEDFTLTPPPNSWQPWYWYDNAWQSEPKQTAE